MLTSTLTRTGGRAILLGAATGARSTLGIGAPLLLRPRSRGGRRRLTRLATVGVANTGELIWDKLPSCPSRLAWPGLTARVFGAGIGVSLLADVHGRARARHSAVAVASAMGTAVIATRWRQHWNQRHQPAWLSGAIEDGLALTSAAVACR